MGHQNTLIVDSALEEVCSQGCDEVNQTIHRLEQDLDIPNLQQLTASDKTAILAELKSIMAVYDARES